MEDKGLNKTNEGVRGRWSEPEKHMYAHTHARTQSNLIDVLTIFSRKSMTCTGRP